MITRTMEAPEGLPPEVLETLQLYVFERLPPGHCMTALLSNDLQGTVAHADDTIMGALRRITQFVYNDLPSDCWGSPVKVQAWLAVRPRVVK
jgi:hypothetical protein